MKDEGMEQISDDGAIKAIIQEVLDENPSQIEQYKAGKTNMFDYFVVIIYLIFNISFTFCCISLLISSLVLI